MDGFVFSAILAAALMHAVWNALVKSGGDRFAFSLALTAGECVLGLALLPLFPTMSAAAAPWLAVSSALHVGYMLFLAQAYAHGDLAQIYPLARGAAPLIVALVGALALGEHLGPAKSAAILLIGCGVMAMSLRGGADLGAMPRRAVFYALGTACFTASYTVVDALGARAAQSPSAYTSAMFALSGAGFVATGFARRGRRALALEARVWRAGAAAGALSFFAYWVVVWAFTRAPVALVAALREVSVLMALLIAVVFLGESGGRWRWIAAALIAAGVALMRL